MVKISLIIPVYNEEACIQQFLNSLFIFKDNFNEIIVVNDGSNDNTLNILNKNLDKIKVVSYKNNRGKSYAIYYGIKHAYYDWVAMLDGDGENDPKYLLEMKKY